MATTQTPETNSETMRPEFVDSHGAYKLYGIRRGLLYLLEQRGHVESVVIRDRGKTKGKRLWLCDSLAKYLHSLRKNGTGEGATQ